jgi:hypothetical protein
VYRELKFSKDKAIVDVWGFWPNRQQIETGGHPAS